MKINFSNLLTPSQHRINFVWSRTFGVVCVCVCVGMTACCTHIRSHSGAAFGSISIKTEDSTDVKIITFVGLFMQCLAFRTLHKPAVCQNKYI